MSRLDDAIDAIENAVLALTSAVSEANAKQSAAASAVADGPSEAMPVGASEDELRAVKSELQEVMRLLEEVQAQPEPQEAGQL